MTAQTNYGAKEFSMGVVSADFTGDGHADVYSTSVGRNSFLVNNGDNTFTQAADGSGAEGDYLDIGPGVDGLNLQNNWSSVAFDYDLDMDLDLHVAGSGRVEGTLTATGNGVIEQRAAVGETIFGNVRQYVHGNGDDSYVILGDSDDVTGLGTGVWGETSFSDDSSAFGAGVWGEAKSSEYDAVYANGDLSTSGFKLFVQPHPTDPSREVRFASLEGNESGTYFRGKTTLTGGVARIDVPEDFRLVTEEGSLTVQLTARGPAQVWFEHYDLNEVRIAGTADVEVHYVVNGIRRGFAEFETIRTNDHFRPRWSGEPYGNQFPDALRAILVQNGILNPDFTPNESTAAQNGWELIDRRSEPGVR